MTRRTCTFCVMNNEGDQTITFDDHGQCNYCKDALVRLPHVYFPNAEGKIKIESLVTQLKNNGKNNTYDCLMGISGGLDSAYLLYLGAANWGLRILAIHVDDGFDTEVSRRNIQKLGTLPNVELRVVNVQQKQFNEVTRAFMLAGVPNLAMPQDNILFAMLYETAKKENLQSFLSGGNFALESVLQRGNTHDAFDLKNIKSIFKEYGRGAIDELAFMSSFKRDLRAIGMGIKTYKPLDWVEYRRDVALLELKDACGFEYYGSKHLENTLTKFVQQYWLPIKFGVDKRTSHLSSMIVSGQMTRDEALLDLARPAEGYDTILDDIKYLCDAFEIDNVQLNELMSEPARQHSDFNVSFYIKLTDWLRRLRWSLKSR